ncbi:MAG: ABC transporter permease [Actinobacteria bacterium]|nr:ABC transporter permease [Actinomycetota bacterium]
MSVTPAAQPPPQQEPTTLAARFALYQRAGGVITPLLTTLLALFIAGLVVRFTTGASPLDTGRAILDGSGLTWFIPESVMDIRSVAGTYDDWPSEAEARLNAEINLQQTLIFTTTLILTGLAVAFAFRCGLFNIGGQGQFFVGAIVAVAVGAEVSGVGRVLHVPLVLLCAALAGAVWAGIAGILRATVGAHEVITTIMLNWIAYWIGSYLFSLGGPLQSDRSRQVPISNDVQESAKLHVFWGDFQGLHVGFFIAIAALVAFYLILNRTTLGYGVRAVGYNPEAARYGGISVSRNYFLAMAISGLFAGLAGAVDIMGWQYRYGQIDIQQSDIGFAGIAVALLGRNTSIGIFFSALLFGALLTGSNTRNLALPIEPELAGNMTLIVQGLVVLFVAADLVILYLWRFRKRLGLPRREPKAVGS